MVNLTMEWINVKEKMPDLEQPVLIYLFPFGEISFAWRDKSYTTEYKEKWITMGDIIYKDNFVSHWMPLPNKPIL